MTQMIMINADNLKMAINCFSQDNSKNLIQS